MFGTNSSCDCHFSGDNLIIQKGRFLYIVVSYRLVFTRLLLTGTLCGLVCRVVRVSTGSFGLNGRRDCMFGTNSHCDCHFSGDNLIIQKGRFLYIVVSYRLVFTRLLLTGTLYGLVCRGVRFSTGSFGLNGSRECMFGTNSGCDCHFSGDNLIIQKERFL